MDELELLRKQIDQIDEKLVELFETRMELVVKIGVIKAQKGIKILDSNREEEVVRKGIMFLKNKELSQELDIFFKNIMNSSKRIMQKTKEL